ncbi:MAG TPA: hypothetical protein VNT99_15405, partial [Methylomirabilota bacterium]|nr:hypothetical protein [Methylomirabilota bacterium]
AGAMRYVYGGTPGFDWRGLEPINLQQVRFAAGRFVIVGHNGITVSSVPGGWNKHASIVFENLHDIAFGANKFVVVGSAGTIVQSDDALPVFSTPRISSGNVHLDLRGGLEPEYRVQSSDNLLLWTNLAVFTNNGEAASFSDNTNSRPRFYRAINP